MKNMTICVLWPIDVRKQVEEFLIVDMIHISLSLSCIYIMLSELSNFLQKQGRLEFMMINVQRILRKLGKTTNTFTTKHHVNQFT